MRIEHFLHNRLWHVSYDVLCLEYKLLAFCFIEISMVVLDIFPCLTPSFDLIEKFLYVLWFFELSLESTTLKHVHLEVGNHSKGNCKQSIAEINDENEDDFLYVVVSDHIRITNPCNSLDYVVNAQKVLFRQVAVENVELFEPRYLEVWVCCKIDEVPETACPMPQYKEENHGFQNNNKNAMVLHQYLQLFK